jgi:diguanylate cyclase (GGDEF)-like protein
MTDDLQMGEAREGRILVVDDSALVRAMVSALLRKVGYVVREAENGAAAVSILLEETFDVVITDLHMPEKDGFEVLETVRRHSIPTEVIILTGTHAKDVTCAVRALRLGAHDFLTKPPAGPHEVIVTVDRAMEKKRLMQANARLMREMEQLSRTDTLTGVWNRRAFEETLRRELVRASRHQLPMSLIMVDIDRFKRINDTYGHRVGDEVLKWFGLHASRVLREGDTIHRYGGEEFAIVLPHTGPSGALAVAKRLLGQLASTPFQESLLVTASAGVASGIGEELEEIDLVAMADAALYQAKREGRNRAVSASRSKEAQPERAHASDVARIATDGAPALPLATAVSPSATCH